MHAVLARSTFGSESVQHTSMKLEDDQLGYDRLLLENLGSLLASLEEIAGSEGLKGNIHWATSGT